MLSSTGLWLFLGLVVVLAIFQRKNLKRLLTAISAQFGKLFKFVWRLDPIAVYQAEVDRSAEEIKQAGEGLEQYRGLVSRLQRQVANGEKESARLTQKIKDLLTAGDENKAGVYAIEFKKVQNDLEKNKTDLASYEVAYQNNLKKVKFANQKIRDAKEKAEKLQAELRTSGVEAEVAKLSINTNITDGLGEIEDEVQRQIDANRAKGQVMQDLSADGLDSIEEEEKLQKVQAQELLDQFKQEMKK